MPKPGTSSDSSPEPPAAAQAPPDVSQPAETSDAQAQPKPDRAVMTAMLVLLTVAALYFGRDIFLPFTLAVLLSFLLEPLVERLRRLRMPRTAAVLLVVVLAVMLVGGLSALVVNQAVDIANNLPAYQKTMQ